MKNNAKLKSWLYADATKESLELLSEVLVEELLKITYSSIDGIKSYVNGESYGYIKVNDEDDEPTKIGKRYFNLYRYCINSYKDEVETYIVNNYEYIYWIVEGILNYKDEDDE